MNAPAACKISPPAAVPVVAKAWPTHAFTREGARGIVADLNLEAAQRVASALAADGHDALPVRVDVAKTADMRDLVKAAFEHHGRIDVLINNAGISHPNQPMLDVTEEFFDRLYAVNVKSIYHSAKECVPVFRRQTITQITKSMAVELAPDNIRANAINPAIADTPLLTTLMGGG
ncbi:MAG: SDR family oxidoreductase [Verrucomicrobia bacterium]|nr:SDR family oxidoreductase [Verrucomicrobiota bacterium]